MARRNARAWVGFGVAFAALLALFFGDALLGLGAKSYTSADFTQGHILTSLGERHRPGNPVISDPVLEMQTWLRFARDEVRAGELPLWNPYNGCGQPLLANEQSAFLSPFNLPFFLFEFDVALLLSAALKLGAAGATMALFLRQLGLGRIATAFGAVAFGFSGQIVVLLGYPHSAVIATLPLALYFLERALVAVERGRGRGEVVAALAGFTLAQTAGLLAAHPEPFECGVVLGGAWFVARSIGMWRASDARGEVLRRSLRLAAGLVIASLAALALAAPQLLPFVEYYTRSGLAAERVYEPLPSLESAWQYLLFPTAVGMPTPERSLSLSLPAPSFELVNSTYVGGTVLLCAFVACAFADARRRAFAFVVLAAGWLVAMVGAFGLARAWDTATVFGHFLPLPRAQPIWILSICVVGAFGLEGLLGLARPRKMLAVAAPVLAFGVLVAAWLRANVLFAEHAAKLEPELVRRVHDVVRDDLLLVAATFSTSALAVGWLALAPSVRTRRVCGAALIAAVFVQCGWLLRDYNPTVDNRYVFPRTPAMQRLVAEVGDGRMLVLGENGIPPESNLDYRLAVPAGFDGLHLRVQDTLYRELFGARAAWRDPQRASPRALRLFGIEYVVTAGDWVPIGTALGERQLQKQMSYSPIELRESRKVVQRFVCARERLSRISVVLSTIAGSKSRGATATLRLVDVESGAVIAEHTPTADGLREGTFYPNDFRIRSNAFRSKAVHALRFESLEFAPREDSLGRTYELTLEATGEPEGGEPFAWATKHISIAGGALDVVGEEHKAVLLFDYGGASSFEPRGKVSRLSLWRFAEGLGPFFSVREALESPSDAATLAALKRSTFDPYRAVILDRGTSAKKGPATTLVIPDGFERAPVATRARVLERTATRVRLEVLRDEPGWLVAAQSWYPGWTATVNGETRLLRRANYAFQAVEVPAGSSIVELAYQPRSFRIGVALSFGTLLLGAVGVVFSRRRASPRSRVEPAA
jgi:hypothetical protein